MAESTNIVEFRTPSTEPKYYSDGPVTFSDYTIGVEHVADILDEVKALHEAHWNEVEGKYLNLPFDADYGLVSLYEAKGRLVLFTVRDQENTLVGNAIFSLGPNLIMRGKVQASDVVFFLLKDYRGQDLATAMLSYIEIVMERLGVSHIHISDKSFAGGRSMETLLTSHSFMPVSKHYVKIMKE